METAVRYPKTLQEAIRYFADEETARQFIIELRWPNGIACPRCGCMEPVDVPSRGIWKCTGCKKQFSLRVGTIFEDSPLPISTWLTAMWLIANAKNGISSCEIARAVGITQKSAWHLAHRIRRVMETGSIEKLDGEVEIDETFIGGKSRNMHSDKRQEMREKGFPKTIVFGMKQRDGEVRTLVVPDTTKDTLQTVIRENVKKGATTYTDTARAYQGMGERYNHATVDHNKGEYVRYEEETMITTNGMENYWSLLDRCYHGTYVKMEKQHQNRYLAEQDFRYNTRKQKDGERFVSLLSGVNKKRLTYDELVTSHLQTLEAR